MALANGARDEIETRRVRLVWHIRHECHVEWVAPLLNDVVENARDTGLSVSVDLYVTRPVLSESDMTLDQSHQAQGDAVDLETDEQPLLSSAIHLSAAAREMISWHAGRADLARIVRDDMALTTERMNVTGEA